MPGLVAQQFSYKTYDDHIKHDALLLIKTLTLSQGYLKLLPQLPWGTWKNYEFKIIYDLEKIKLSMYLYLEGNETQKILQIGMRLFLFIYLLS